MANSFALTQETTSAKVSESEVLWAEVLQIELSLVEEIWAPLALLAS